MTPCPSLISQLSALSCISTCETGGLPLGRVAGRRARDMCGGVFRQCRPNTRPPVAGHDCVQMVLPIFALFAEHGARNGSRHMRAGRWLSCRPPSARSFAQKPSARWGCSTRLFSTEGRPSERSGGSAVAFLSPALSTFWFFPSLMMLRFDGSAASSGAFFGVTGSLAVANLFCPRPETSQLGRIGSVRWTVPPFLVV